MVRPGSLNAPVTGAAVAVAAAWLACHESASDSAAPVPAPPPAVRDAAPDAAPPFADRALAGRPEEVAAALEAVGAVPAWEAVVERHAYLARRDAKGVVYGTIARAKDEGPWLLVDDTQGQGALAIELALPSGVPLRAGERVAAWGAWICPEVNRWVWRVSALGRLPGGERIEGVGITVAGPSAAPSDAEPPSTVASGATVVFLVVERPIKVGDGWGVADVAGSGVVARVVLPGERGAYGGQDMRAPAESWTLERGKAYFVRAQRVWRSRDPSEPAVIYAAGRPTLVR